MSEDEIMVLVFSVMAGTVGAFLTRVSSFPRPFTENNPGIGLMRLSVAASLGWTLYVIQYHGDPSITGIYIVFYLVMAYAAAKLFGQVVAQLYGLHLRSDVYERKNLAAALFVSSFTLATGIVFGGSLWGEADPLSDAEGGWWIPVGFFLMGWVTLALATAFYLWREPGRFRQQLCQERDSAMAWSASIFILSTASLILGGVAGDFWGWRHGVLGMGTIALMLTGHELIMATGQMTAFGGILRVIERGLYIALAVLVWYLNRAIDQLYMGG